MIREIRVELPASEPRHDVVATLWARTHVEHLMGQDYHGIQQGNARQELREAITKIGLDYRLMTQFTSFVAVEEMVITDGGQPRRIDVPVEMPEGVSYEGVFGGREADYRALNAPASIAPRKGIMREFSTAKRHYSGVFEAPLADTSLNAGALKLHPAIAALVDRLKQRNQAPTAEEAKFVKNGRAEVQVWLSDMTPTTLDEIKKLGFEIVLQPKTGKLIIGRVPIEKLPLLAEMKSVRYLAPQIL
jgi:Ca-activated chloride channel family protein